MDHFCKNALPGHNAVSHDLEYFTAIMTLFPDLGDLQDHIVALQAGSYRKCFKIKPLYDQIFPESTILYRCSFGFKFFYFFLSYYVYVFYFNPPKC